MLTVAWPDVLHALTPWEQRAGRWYKREDYCAPLGYGHVNGAKFRQCYWLLQNAVKAGYTGIVTGASVLSPQIPMSAVIAQHFGLTANIIIGGTTVDKAMRHPNVRLAANYGATFTAISVGYNPALQAAVTATAASTGLYHLRYGISPDPGTEAMTQFHQLGAEQLDEIPEQVSRLVVPTGSANTTISILLGLANRPHNVSEVLLVGIGPNREKMIQTRLDSIAKHTNCPAHPDTNVTLLDLHTPGIVAYGKRVKASLDGITFHPTYEAKVVNHLLHHPHLAPGFIEGDGTTGFWIIGSEPQP